MPRQKKAQNTTKAVSTEKKLEVKQIEKNTRKAYPTLDERITKADENIDRLEKLSASREELVAKTAALLAERQEALAKSQTALEKVKERKERLIIAKDKPIRKPRVQKREQDEQYQKLLTALKESGKSLDDLLAALK